MPNPQIKPQAIRNMRKRDHLRAFYNLMLEKIRALRSAPSLREDPETQDHAGRDPHSASYREDSWDLDPAFFEALSRWALTNPNNTLDHFLERTIDAIENGREFLEMVPDGPIPIRGFCKVFAHLLKLGGTVGKAQRDVYEFSKHLIHWVGVNKLLFQSGNLGTSALQMQRSYLNEMRALIDEICKWAAARLADRRWSIQGVTVEKEINEFKARIAEARAFFVNIATINVAQNQDQHMKDVQKLISTIQEIQTTQMDILGFLQEQENRMIREKFLDKILSPHAADKTAYDQQGKRPCSVNTRVKILQDIKTWVFDISDSTPRFLWLTGDPGSGKSAITTSIAQECKTEKVLWAQFFINRNLDGTTDPTSYFPSIAKQLAGRSPAVALALFNALEAQPTLVDDISQDQAGELFVNSLKAASLTEPTRPVVVVIDGLDETMIGHLESTAAIFASAVLDLPSNVKVFISSRTETEIQRPFSIVFAERPKEVYHIHLDTSSPSSIQDVSLFLSRGIITIAKQNHLDVLQWPGEEQLNALCKRAAGLFIWAVTVIGFIREEVKASGKEILNTILDSLTAEHLEDINVLYNTILGIVFHNRKDPWEFERFRRIVGCIVCLQEPLCIADISALLDLRNPVSNEPVDILHFIRRLRTVLVAGADEITPQTIPRLHKSFFEYITRMNLDQQMAHKHSIPSLFVSTNDSNCELALQSLLYITNTYIPKTKTNLQENNDWETQVLQSNDSPLLLQYSYDHAFSHLTQSCCVSETGTLTLRVALSNKLVNLPKSGDNDQKPIEPISRGHKKPISCISFSPDGRYIASGSYDKTIILWDVSTGRHVGSPLKGHSGWVKVVAFSPDGLTLVSGSYDETICLWNIGSCLQIGDPLSGHRQGVDDVAFSATGKYIVSTSGNRQACMWELDSRKVLYIGHAYGASAVAFSPPILQAKEYITLGSKDGTIWLWECYGLSVNYVKKYEGHTSVVLSIAFMPVTSLGESLRFISGSRDKTVRLWDVSLGGCIHVFTHQAPVFSLTFSSQSRNIVSLSENTEICIWDTETGNQIGQLKSGTQSVTSHGELLASDTGCDFQIWTQKEASSGTMSINPIYDTNNASVASVSRSHHGNIATAFVGNNVLVHIKSTNMFVVLVAPSGLSSIMDTIVSTFSPDGNTLAVVYPGRQVGIWKLDPKQLLSLYTLPVHIKNPLCISFSSEGEHLQGFGMDGSHQVWNAMTGTYIATITDDLHLRPPGIGKNIILGKIQYTWSPVKNNPDFGLWAILDGRLIRWDKNNVVTVCYYLNGRLEEEE